MKLGNMNELQLYLRMVLFIYGYKNKLYYQKLE